MLTKEEGGTVCGMPSNSTPLPPSGSPNRGMEDSIRDALALCRAGRSNEIDTVKMLQAADEAQAEKRDFDYGCAIELANISIKRALIEASGEAGGELRPEGTRPS